MAAREQIVLSMRALSLRSTSGPRQLRSFTSSAKDQASTVQQRRRHQDPYTLAQAKARKAANLSRQEVLKKERAVALGDPVRGITTPFIQSFDEALPTTPPPPTSTETPTDVINTAPSSEQPPLGPSAEHDSHLNFFLKKDDVDSSLQRSQMLSAPVSSLSTQFTESFGDEGEQNRAAQDHARATEALSRIASLANGSSKDRLRVNIQRCVSTFGRHNTDKSLEPRIINSGQTNQLQKMERVGPDTGSSEVQIGILTAKIRTLANFLETRGKMDKVNKRNLRLLVHRRQKLLTYMRRKERGGPRWTNLIETLGLTEGTWQGEITL